MAASNKAMGDLHAKLARVLDQMMEPVVHPAVLDEDGGEIKAAWVEQPAATVLAVAAKFLKDNSIFSGVEEDSNLKALKEKLAQRGRVSDADIKEAVHAVGGKLLQ